MFVLICHCGGTCLIRILYPKKSKWSNTKKTACSLFCVLIIYILKVQMCYEMFVLICHHSGTCLIRILCPKIVKKPKNCFLIVFLCSYNRSKCVMHYHLHLFIIVYNYGISLIAFHGWYHTFKKHCFEYISMAIALHRCLLYMSGTRFSMWIQLWCLFDNWTNLFW